MTGLQALSEICSFEAIPDQEALETAGVLRSRPSGRTVIEAETCFATA
jgi:hypothetical protein